MTSNLVERLRSWPYIYPNDRYKPEGHLYKGAANRIEALEAEVARLRGAVAEAVYLLDPEAEDVLERAAPQHGAGGGKMSDAPNRIWLQWDAPYGENTFCEDQINADDVEYIRADLHQQALDRIEALEAENKRLLEAECPKCRRREEEAREAFRIKCVCDTCGYQSMDHISMCRMDDCYGHMIPRQKEKSDD